MWLHLQNMKERVGSFLLSSNGKRSTAVITLLFEVVHSDGHLSLLHEQFHLVLPAELLHQQLHGIVNRVRLTDK